MVLEIISVGTEILMGNIVNTNAAYLSEKLALIGVDVFFQTTVGDNAERLELVLKSAIDRSDVVILSGGLGPTEDDLTKEIAAKVCRLELHEDKAVRESIEIYFKAINKSNITKNNWKQAMVPEGAKVIENHNGTAPGLIIERSDNKKVILLPGPPNELCPMFEESIVPYLVELQPSILYSEMIKIVGLAESYVETEIKDLIDAQSNPTIAPYAKTGEVHLRVTARAESKKEAKQMVKPIVDEITSRFGDSVYTTKENETLEQCIVKLLKKKNISLATAESCSGGLLAARLINVPGISEFYGQGYVTYSNKAKKKLLDVNKATLKKYGAVSKQTAKEMASGAAYNSDADVAVAITGIAGPDGGSEEKPVGLVYICCYANEKTVVKEFHFSGDRNKIREYSVVNAMNLLRSVIIENY